jgi:hypothetical protein
MDNGNFEGPELKLTCNIGADGVIYVTASGKLNNNSLEIFTEWTEQVKLLIAKVAEEHDIVRVCSDVTAVEHFETKPIAPLRELFAYNKRYHMKSAIIVASFFMRNLLDAVIEFTGRKNIRQFSTKEKALGWLFEEEPPTAPAAGGTPDATKE